MDGAAKGAGQIKEVKYLAIDPAVIKVDGVMMTDGISNKNGIVPALPGEVLDKLDHTVIYERLDWKKPEVLERLKVAEKFEILVPKQIPLKFILNL